MLKQILLPALLVSACCIASFVPARQEKRTTTTCTKPSPQFQTLLVKTGVSLSGGGTGDVVITFETVGNTILDIKLYQGGNPCLQYQVTGYTGGPIDYSRGTYKTINPLVISFTGGTCTISGTFTQFVYATCGS